MTRHPRPAFTVETATEKVCRADRKLSDDHVEHRVASINDRSIAGPHGKLHGPPVPQCKTHSGLSDLKF